MKNNNLSSKRMQSGPDQQDNTFEEEAKVDYLLEPEFVPAPVKRPKPLARLVDLLVGMKLLTTNDIIIIIIEQLAAIEVMATVTKNLKDTFKRHFRRRDDMQRAATTVMTKKVGATGSATALGKDNIRLRARLYNLEQMLAMIEHSAFPGVLQTKIGVLFPTSHPTEISTTCTQVKC